jgi:hypothetical protein
VQKKTNKKNKNKPKKQTRNKQETNKTLPPTHTLKNNKTTYTAKQKKRHCLLQKRIANNRYFI